jgi:hypothetical protein
VPGGRSTYGDCDFLLSWRITEGHFGSVDLSGLNVSIAGTYNDDVGDDIWMLLITSPNQPFDDSIRRMFGSGGFDGGAAGFV